MLSSTNIIPSTLAGSLRRMPSSVLVDFDADMTYPSVDSALTHCSQKFTNKTYFSGPNTDPCLTPLPCLKGVDTRPLPMVTCVVALGPSRDPVSMPTSSCTSGSGIPTHVQLKACAQGSIVSNALDRSATITWSDWPEILASSSISAQM